MKVLLIIVALLMTISGCKISYQKSHVTEGTTVAQTGITLNAKVCLESAFDNDVLGVEMITNLNVLDIIPTETPYAGAPWYHYSFNDFSLTADILDPDLNPVTTADRIFVDWVLVEVYKDINGTMTFMDSQSGLIHFNGTIYDTSGYQGILFPELSAGNYYVNIIHRNHLSVGSEDPVALSTSYEASTYNIDFTDAATEYLDEGTLIPSPFVSMGVNATKCLKAGDLDGDLDIDNDDEAVIGFNIADVVSSPRDDTAILGYLNSDMDFDGVTQRYTTHPAVILNDQAPDLLLIQANNPTVGALHGY